MEKETLDFVRRMARMAEYRDEDAAQHRERVRNYCQLITHCLGLSNQQSEVISVASYLHDVGKVGLPESIANKAGDLTAYEWDVMKRHTTIGAALLKGSSSVVLQVAETIALTHHERWDGSGYPNALRGEEIPLSGRVCALADVFDALTTPRNYKKEISFEEAMTLVRDSSGHLFDPNVVSVFLESSTEVQKIQTMVYTTLLAG